MKYLKLFVILIILFSACSKEKKSEIASGKMQDFVINISNYARGYDENFIIIPQNGVELAFVNSDITEGLDSSYMNSVDGFGVEELFYDGTYSPDGERIAMLDEINVFKKVMVSEYIKQDFNIPDAINRNYEKGFICFPRISTNYDYLQVPDSVISENANNISDLSLAQNYLYLISTDNFQTKEEMLNVLTLTNFDVIIMDLFFDDVSFTSEEINQLKTKANGAQRLVISYINIGSAEKFRYYWGKNWGLHHPLWLKRKYAGYDDEFWVKFWESDWQKIIFGNDNSYMKKIINAGFDGAYLDNVEAYYFLYYKD